MSASATKKTTLFKVLWLIAAIAPITFQVVTTAVQFMQPGYNPLHETISTLVWGRQGWIQTALFYFMGFAMAALAVRLIILGKGIRYRLGALMLALIATGFIIIALRPTNMPGRPETFTGVVHAYTTFAMILLFIPAAFLMAPGLSSFFSRWLSVYTRATGVIMLLLLVTIAWLALSNFGWLGMMERLMLVAGLSWLQVLSIQTL